MIKIRKANLSDKKFIVSFQLNMAMETENLKLDEQTVIQGVTRVLSDPSKGQYFVAETNDNVIGSLLTTYEWSDWRNGTTLWIQSVYVDTSHRGNGAYKALYAHVKSMVQSDPNYTGIRLYVHKGNEKAKKVYTNLGMNGEHYELYEWMKES
ncbi:GNAT family N-acetyltransferase [Reichenbachiella sp. MALMAid0571]|uniref:GNAT family N-acetyltransferase n=1 Tax=Reichenbachiella sp. MALMAid0571 TaxID=3143939 RepID=UPI0032DE506B